MRLHRLNGDGSGVIRSGVKRKSVSPVAREREAGPVRLDVPTLLPCPLDFDHHDPGAGGAVLTKTRRLRLSVLLQFPAIEVGIVIPDHFLSEGLRVRSPCLA